MTIVIYSAGTSGMARAASKQPIVMVKGADRFSGSDPDSWSIVSAQLRTADRRQRHFASRRPVRGP
jgi:hypothetical protein